ncbi:ribonuclease III family protein [Nodosilinea sp. AN01ver1]|uniref:ribonuclease III family protein n=1 Tax=Nodosilinea sp. AN01ver1 TaxID=3423362 RepID=UPI003D31B203
MYQLPVFHNPELLLQALTHSSYVNEHLNAGEDNERMEHLGDALLGSVVTAMLYEQYPQFKEGLLTETRKPLVKNKKLAKVARLLQIGEQLRLGRGEELQGGRDNEKNLSGAFEAVIGAYFLDSGYEEATAYIQQLFHKC